MTELPAAELLVSSSFVKTTSLLCIADTFPYKLLSNIPTPLPLPGPLILAAWERLLSTHPDKLYVHTIVCIIRYGVRGYTGPDQLTLSPNLTSANQSIETLNRDLQDQKAHNRLMRVSTPQAGERFISSPLGLVPKSGSNTSYRIHHLSFPPGKSVMTISHQNGAPWNILPLMKLSLW